MLEPYKLDLEFARDVHNLAESTSAIAKSLAVIAGVVAKRDGIGFINPITTKSGNNKPTVSNSDPLSKEDTIPLQGIISNTYDTLNDTPSSWD